MLGVGGAEERGEIERGVDVRERAKGQEVVGNNDAAQRARGDGEQGVVVGEEEEGTLVEVEGGGVGGVGHGRVGELEGDEGEVADHVQDVANQVEFAPYALIRKEEPNRPRLRLEWSRGRSPSG